jgi:hypothetical protein
MTASTTEREILSPRNGRVPEVDSPAVRARARASLTITDSEIKKGDRISRAVAGWWGFHVQPLSMAEAWMLSKVDTRRVPNGSGLLCGLWHIFNWTDRLIMFALIQVAPTFLQAPLRWIACRPTRRYGLYTVTGLLITALLIGRSTP